MPPLCSPEAAAVNDRLIHPMRPAG